VKCGVRSDVFIFAVGDRVCNVRLAQGKSVATLAKATDLAPSGVWSIERGRTAPNARTLSSIATALGVKSSDLLNVDETDDLGAIYEALRSRPDLVDSVLARLRSGNS
jgi:transcriptional regulator with XRE-family HTH domain